MGVGFKVGGSAVFKSTVTIQANPNATISLVGPVTYTATANSNGVAVFTVKKKGTYSIGTNNTGNSEAEGNTGVLNILKSGQSYTGQRVLINVPASLSVGNYSSNVLTAYWTRPSSNWTGCNLRWGTSTPTSRSDGTALATGAGGSIALNASGNVNGYNHSGLTAGTTYYYSIFSYLTIGNTTYWSTTRRSATGTARYYINTSGTLSGTGTFTVPTGWRKITIFLVGGGGGGGTYSRGGGGGGYTKTYSFSVTPGATYSYGVGSGGAAGNGVNGTNGGNTTFGPYSATGGYGGTGSGGNGGSGGGAGAVGSKQGKSGGSNGSDGSSNSGHNGGYGQGSTTRAWGIDSSSYTLYSGGGGGGGKSNYSGGSGGDGGGGNSGWSGTAATQGTDGSGGGGGSSYTGTAGRGGHGTILYKCVA